MTDKMRIITNHHARDLVHGFELSAKERSSFDYYNEEELDGALFFRYKGEAYDLNEFCRPQRGLFPKFWDGYSSDSFFSGILVHFCDENDAERGICEYADVDYKIIVATYIC